MSKRKRVEDFIEGLSPQQHEIAFILKKLLDVEAAANALGLRAMNVISNLGATDEAMRTEIVARLRLLYNVSKAFDETDALVLPTMLQVESSNISAVGFDGELLFVEFRNGSIYDYVGVHRDIFAHLLIAESVGKFFNEHIKGGDYACTKRRDRS